MAATVVHDLEMIEIQIEECVWSVALDLLRSAGKFAAIEQARQWIMGSLIGNFLRKRVCFRNVVTLDEYAGYVPLSVIDGLVGEIDIALFQFTAGHPLQLDWHGTPDKRDSSSVDPVELIQKPLRNDFGQRLGENPSDDLAMSYQLIVSIVGDLIDVSRATQDTHEARCLLKQLMKTFPPDLKWLIALRVVTRSLSHGLVLISTR